MSKPVGPESPASIRAPGKLTTSLRVVGRRADGMHLLDAEMVSLSLCDFLELSPGAGLEIVDEISWSGPDREAGSVMPGSRPCREAGSGPSEGPNLVLRALDHVGRIAAVRLTKRIPPGAGLGGGSADAAAVLAWAGVRDLEAASRLGADVPFCLSGARRAAVGGIGEVVRELPAMPGHALLVVPNLTVSTPEVYSAWDALGGPRGMAGNDLEPAALARYPDLRWWRDVLAAISGKRPRLAGSGGTWFIEGELRALETLAAEVRAEIVAARERALVTVVVTAAAPPPGTAASPPGTAAPPPGTAAGDGTTAGPVAGAAAARATAAAGPDLPETQPRPDASCR